MSLRSNKSFVRLFLGRLVSNAGDSMYGIAGMWLIHELTGSTIYTGIAGFLIYGVQPLQFLVGPLADRWSLRKILVVTQFIQLIGVLIIPVVAATGSLTVFLVIALIPILELVNLIVYPAQSAVLPRLVDDQGLVRANSLFSFAFGGTDVLFNALSGILIAIVGAVTLYLIDAVTFAIAIILFWGLKIPSTPSTEKATDGGGRGELNKSRYVTELREGINYIRGSAVSDLLLGAMIANLAFGMMIAVLPDFAAALAGATAYGFLYAARAGGSLMGSAGATYTEDKPFGPTAIIAKLVSGICWIGVVAGYSLPITTMFMFLALIPTGVTNVLSGSMLQSAADDDMLGRVMSVRRSAATVMIPVGSLLGGVLASVTSSRLVLSTMAISQFFLCLYYFVRPRVRSLSSIEETDEAALGLGAARRTDS